MKNLTDQEKIEIEKSAAKDDYMVRFLFENGVSYRLSEDFILKSEKDFCDGSTYYSFEDIESLFAALAKKYTDGHYTILKFTTGYKAGFGTPDIRSGGDDVNIEAIPMSDTIMGAVLFAIISKINFQDITENNG